MTRLTWLDLKDRGFETGLDRGVLYPKVGPAVPWTGLTGVNEVGAESAVAYYMDGRPFLWFPKPKEFSAEIKAYMYPDEFSQYAGLVEATDGMYLDSQQADSFGLSYRTLVGNASGDAEANYKIHLVYNAVVTPSSIGYATLSNSITATEFSWQIQAVPVVVEGYRPTAHIIIDTRHMDEERKAEIETLLYGDSTTDASLPDPQVIFDMLSFGEAIIITDNGDGTWKAEASYKNLYMIGDGIFQIDNVDATFHGDGTYDISSTNV